MTLVNSCTKDDAVVWCNNARDCLCFASLDVIVLKAKRKKNEDCWLLLHLTTNVFSSLELQSVRTHFSRHVDNDVIMDGKKPNEMIKILMFSEQNVYICNWYTTFKIFLWKMYNYIY